MNEEVIKSFLVDLGFKVKEPELKKFANTIEGVTKSAAKMGAVIVGVGTAVATVVHKYAQHMEELYYASQRTHASAKNIYALEYAAKNLGASTQDVQGAIESLGQFRFSIPGWERFLQSIGVKTRNAKGQIRDMGDVMVDLGKRLGHMPTYMQMQYAHILGINYRMLRAISNPEFAAQYEKSQKITRASGADMQKLMKQTHEFETRVRTLFSEFKTAGAGIASAFFDKVGPGMDDLLDKTNKWIEDEMPNFKTVTGSVIDSVAKDFHKAAHAVDDLLNKLHKFGPLKSIEGGASWVWQHVINPGGSFAPEPFNTLNRPALPSGAWPWEVGGSSGSATINQKTDIHVHGGGSPTETGKAVGAEQNRVNERMLRNLKGRVR